MIRFWPFLREQIGRACGCLRRRRFDQECDEEFDTHLKLLAERFVKQGLNEENAWLEARKQFGGVVQLKSELRERGRFMLFEMLLQDARYVARQLRRSPLFTLAAVSTLALGIGANTAIFTLIDQLILRLLPVRDPQTIVGLIGQGEYYGSNMGARTLSYTMYQTLRDRNQVFTSMMCRRPAQFTAIIQSEGEIVSGELVTGNYFPLLGVKSTAGRLFDASDDLRPGAHPVAVLSYAYWKDRFACDEEVIGSKILVNNYPLTIIGVTQPSFSGVEPGLNSRIFVPMMMTAQLYPHDDFANMWDSRLRWVNVYGRLRSGVTRERAKAALQPLFHRLLETEAREPGFAGATPYVRDHFLRMWLDVVPGGQGKAELRRLFQRPLSVLISVTGFLLLIACANLASLLAARAAARQKEIAVRLAIGSSRGRLVQQLLTESVLLGLAGGAAGVGVAVILIKGLFAFLPSSSGGYTLSSVPDLRVLGFAFLLSLVTGVVFGLVPAIQAVRPNLGEGLKNTAAHVSGGSAFVTFRRVLVTAQITLSLLLLIGAGLFVRSLVQLHSVDPGFEMQSLAQFKIDVDSLGYSEARARAFFDRLESRLRQIPSVRAVGYADVPVLSGSAYDWENNIAIAGRASNPGENRLSHMNRVSSGYFETLGIHLLSGRVFAPLDTERTPPVVVVNESFAKHYFGGEPAIGHLIGRGEARDTPTNMTIVGVVNDTHYEDLRQAAPRQVYLASTQGPAFEHTVYFKVKGDASRALEHARTVAHELEPRAPLTEMKTLQRKVNESLATERMIASLSTGFSFLATMLAVLGLYGVVAYMVNQRAREIGIRVALGAVFGNVVWLIMREVLLMVAAGVIVALPLALALAQLVRSELFGVQPADPLSIAIAVLLLAGVALLAGYLPARRAAMSDPLRVLRYE